MHSVGELNHHDGTLARGSDKPASDRPRALAELAKDDVHAFNLASMGRTSTGHA
jgi:hypothetical protein